MITAQPPRSAAALGERARRAAHRLGALRAGAATYLVAAVATGAIVGALVAGLAWGAVELRHYRHQREAIVFHHEVRHSWRHTRRLLNVVLGGAVVHRDGVLATVGSTLMVGVFLVALVLWSLVAIVTAGHEVPLLLALVVTVAVALWRRHDQRAIPLPERPDLDLIAYVEAHSFPGDTVADFVMSAVGAVSIDEARRVTDAYNAGMAAQRFEDWKRRSEAARRAHERRQR